MPRPDPADPEGNTPRMTRKVALAYLPTVGLWSLVRAIQFYRVNPRG